MLGLRPTGDEAIDFLSLLSEVNRRRVLEGSTKAAYAAGSIAFHPEGPERPFVLERGLARVYASVPGWAANPAVKGVFQALGRIG